MRKTITLKPYKNKNNKFVFDISEKLGEDWFKYWEVENISFNPGNLSDNVKVFLNKKIL